MNRRRPPARREPGPAADGGPRPPSGIARRLQRHIGRRRSSHPAPRAAEPPSANRSAAAFALALAVLVALGAVLLMLPVASRGDRATSPVDALFTAVSASAVTGLVVVDTADHWSRFGQVVVLALVQLGGLGFAVGASMLLQVMRRGHGASLSDQLLMRDGAAAFAPADAVRLVGRITRFTLGVEAIGAILLSIRFAFDMPVPVAIWHGLFTAVTAFSNAGFDLEGGFRSLAGWRDSIWVNLVVAALVQCGALGFIVFDDVRRCRAWRKLPLDTKLVLLGNAALLVGAAAWFLAAEWGGALVAFPVADKALAAMFQSVAARSGGFATVDWAAVAPVTQFVWLLVMLVGGASGSTAGGVRLTTAAVLVVAVLAAFRGRIEPHVFGRRLSLALVMRAMAVVAAFILFHFVASIALALTENEFGGRDLPFGSIMFEAMSALATVGLSAGLTPTLTDAGKLILCLAMFVGRLGPLTLAYALQRRQHAVRYRFPEEPVRIG